MTGAQGTYLDAIVRDVRARLEGPQPARPALDAMELAAPRSLVAEIRARRAMGELAIIAEIKRRSPSVGDIDLGVSPSARAEEYERAGAAGISVLTEMDHFGGALTDLVAARASTARTPLLRKDFIVDARQLDEARAAGASAALLIAALHDGVALRDLVAHAHALELEVLLEVHDEAELERALTTDAALIGVNHRDLRSFTLDLGLSARLAPAIPSDRVIVAESGVRGVADASRLRAAGVDALLVGETLMRADDPGACLRSLATASAVTTEVAT